MDSGRLGKVLGQGVRLAARTAMDAADAALADDPKKPGAPTVMAAKGRASAKAPSAVRSQQVARAAQPMRETVRNAKKAGRTLWLEMTASFFLLFALPFVGMAVRMRSGVHAADANHARFLMCAGLAVLFLYFSATGFARAWRRK